VEEGEPDQRYRLLESLREWGNGQLLPKERLLLRRRHAYYFLQADFTTVTASSAAVSKSRSIATKWEQDTDNLRAASDYFLDSAENQDIGAGLRFLMRTHHHWTFRLGLHQEAADRKIRQLDRAEAYLAATGMETPPDWLDDMIHCAITVVLAHTDPELADKTLDRVLELLAMRPARSDLQRLVPIRCAEFYFRRSDLDRGKAFLLQAIAICREQNQTDGGEYILAHLYAADLASWNGAYEEMRDLMRHSLEIVRRAEAAGKPVPTHWQGGIPLLLGHAETHLGNLSVARRYLSEAATVFHNTGELYPANRCLNSEAEWYTAVGDDSTAVTLYRRMFSRGTRFIDPPTAYTAVLRLCQIFLRSHKYSYVARLLGALTQYATIYPQPMTSHRREILATLRREIDQALGADVAESEWARGNSMSIHEMFAMIVHPAEIDADTISLTAKEFEALGQLPGYARRASCGPDGSH